MSHPIDAGALATVFRVGDAVILWQSPEAWIATTVTERIATLVFVADAPSPSWPAPVLMRLRPAIVRGGLRLVHLGPGHARASADFLVTAYRDESDTAAAEVVFEGVELWADPRYVLGALDETCERDAAFVDSGVGPVSVEPLRAYLDETLTLTAEEDTRAEAWAFELRLHRLRGRAKPFWAETASRDFPLAGAPAGATLPVAFSPLVAPADYAGGRVLVRFDDHTAHPATIAAAEAGAITLDAAPPDRPIAAISHLARVRLAADAVETRFEEEYVQTTLTARRLDHEL